MVTQAYGFNLQGEDLVEKWCWVWDGNQRAPYIKKIKKYDKTNSAFPYMTYDDDELFKFARLVTFPVFSKMLDAIRKNEKSRSYEEYVKNRWAFVWDSNKDSWKIKKIIEYRRTERYPYVTAGDRRTYMNAIMLTKDNIKEMIDTNFKGEVLWKG